MVAIQESHIQEWDKRPYFEGYQCYESAGSSSLKGARGLITAVATNAPRLVSFEREQYRTQNQICVNVMFQGGAWNVLNVYVPSSPLRKAVEENIKATVTNLLSSHPLQGLILMGDFNVNPARMKRWVVRAGLPLEILHCSGHQATFTRSRTTVDYILVHRTRVRQFMKIVWLTIL